MITTYLQFNFSAFKVLEYPILENFRVAQFSWNFTARINYWKLNSMKYYNESTSLYIDMKMYI